MGGVHSATVNVTMSTIWRGTTMRKHRDNSRFSGFFFFFFFIAIKAIIIRDSGSRFPSFEFRNGRFLQKPRAARPRYYLSVANFHSGFIADIYNNFFDINVRYFWFCNSAYDENQKCIFCKNNNIY